MSRRRLGTFCATLGLAWAMACNEGGRPSGHTSDGLGGTSGLGPRATGGAGGTGTAGQPGTGGTGTAAAGSDAAIAEDTAAPSGGRDDTQQGAAAGQGAKPDDTVAICGNGLRESPEQCDGDDADGFGCTDLGFDGGELSCDSSCVLILSACTGTENCIDGRDNDGDQAIDCADPDCAATCEDSCGDAIATVGETGTIGGALAGRGAGLAPHCSRSPERSEAVFAVTVTSDGYLEALLEASSSATVSLRMDCGDNETEIGCSAEGSLSVMAFAGETLYLVVEGDSSDGFGFFELTLSHRDAGCGNAVRERGEEGEDCDDGNADSGDGCSDTCELEPTEIESNRSFARANVYTEPFFASISGELDEDYVEVVVDEPVVGFHVNTYDLGDNACGKNELDSLLRLYASDRETLLAEDDDGGAGYCASIDASFEALAPGSYYVVVSASPAGSASEFPYLLSIVPNLCGNGVLSPGEDCDDGNQLRSDGCSELCTSEY